MSATVLVAAACVPATAAAAPTPRAQLDTALTAALHHHTLTAKSAQHIATLARRVHKTAPKACVSALRAAERLPKDRRHRARVLADVRAARKGLAACTPPPVSALPAPVAPAPPAVAPAPKLVGGIVVNSQGTPAPNIPITVLAHTGVIPFHGSSQWTATTDATGHFTLPISVATVQSWWSWEATGMFSWGGGADSLDLGSDPVGADPANLHFSASLGSVNERLFVNNGYGCGLFGDGIPGAGALYPSSRAGVTSVSLTLSPSGPLADGSTGTATTLSFSKSDFCLIAYANLPAGPWTVSNVVDNLGNPVWVSLDDQSWAPTVNVFPHPVAGETQQVDLHYPPA